MSLNWEKGLGTLLLEEGLATQVSKAIIPGENDSYYVEHQPGWFEECKQKKTLIIEGISPYLDKSSSDVLWKFTFGTGTTNQTREAYFAGWEIVQFLLDQGYSFSELAHISENDIPDFIKNTIYGFKEELKR
ncbi:hypothetical protein N783_07625 [Pontibacillus marinus BH030004 = DSM 16465]|uniref:Uncharacterized protein n=1 Tax=Pontibacillus marinus BH030004 = DSM 16465 TaxID=1385511 RepID=A0A0A5GE95_9BACI|nr:hypothetical protein N783_07625 [Pontibacillus marinus BH030004 = DSM 16465]